MRRTDLFEQGYHLRIQELLKEFINSQLDFLTLRTVSSPRAVGDALQSVLEEHFGNLLSEYIESYSSSFARRAIADLAFTDTFGFYHVVDVKTHRLDTAFSMPNLTSVERLARYYEDDRNYFDVLLVDYSVSELHIHVEQLRFIPIEFLSWDCLTKGALGWGQIQIASSNRVLVDASLGRKRWMLTLCDRLMEFYPAEIAKIGERMERFARVRDFWLSRAE